MKRFPKLKEGMRFRCFFTHCIYEVLAVDTERERVVLLTGVGPDMDIPISRLTWLLRHGGLSKIKTKRRRRKKQK